MGYFKKAIYIVLAVLCFNLSAFSQDISLKNRDITLKEAMEQLKTVSGYSFVFSSMDVDTSKRISLSLKDATIEEAVQQILKGQKDIDYEIQGKKIIIKRTTVNQQLSKREKISGRVLDANGEPAIGATIIVKGTTVGTTTDIDGNFSLETNIGAILEISYVGYQTRLLKVQAGEKIVISLTEDSQLLDEVIVVGYGTTKRADMIGAVSSVSNKAMKGRAFLNIDQALMGQAAGVSVTPNDGQPGKNSTVRIRGIGTFNNNNPLYIIDGVPISENGADIINPQDVESISVLKDAASASIYGSRAGNGVIIITTKKGTNAKPVVFYDMNIGFNQASNKLDLLNAEQYTMISDEALVNAGRDSYWKGTTGRANTDWQNLIFRNGFVQSHSIGVRGGKKDVRYYLSAGYDDQEGTLLETGFTRYSIKSNIDIDITKKVKAGFNLSFTRRKSQDIEQGINSVLMNAVRMPATVPAYNDDGTLGYPIGNEGDGQNPIGYASRSQATSKTDRGLINAFIQYAPIPELVFRSNLSADIINYQYSKFSPTFVEGSSKNDLASLSESYTYTNSISWESTLTYSKKFGKSNIVGMVGHSLITSDYKYTNASKKDFLSNDDYMHYFDAGIAQDQVSGNRTDWALVSYFGRIDYSFMDRYLLQLNIRSDGSSRFGKNNRWGTFPSAAIGWRISEENFMKNIQWISNLKLRASYGVLGTQPNAIYGFTTSFNKSTYVLGSDQSKVIGYYPGGKSNDDFKWETTKQVNVGLDLGLFDGKINLSLEYYNKHTQDILQNLPYPGYSGMDGMLTNIGEMRNSGFEFSGQYYDNINDFNYNLGVNFSTLKNEVLKLYDNNSPINGSYNRTEVGRSIGEFYGFVYDGIFQNEEEIKAHKVQPNAQPGDVRFKNINNDNSLDNDDMTFLGSPLPKITYGMNLGFNYKGLDFSMIFQGVAGNKIYYSGKTYLINGGNNFNKSVEILDRWQKEGDITDVPRVTISNSNDNFRRSSLFIEDGSYLRISNLQIGYTLNQAWLKKIGISKLRPYVSINNLYTFTKYSGYDPAVSIADIFSPGNDMITYPVPRTVLAGLSLTF